MRFMVVAIWSLLVLLAAPCLAGDYVIGDGDTLQVSVWEVPELSVAAIVRPDGKITLPAIGDVLAAGQTPAQLGGKLTQALEAFIKKPIVTVSVAGITNNRIYVFGGGPTSGVHNLPARTTLLKFLCSLGDLKNADLQRSYLLRDGKKLDVSLFEVFVTGKLDEDVELQAEDLIYIPDNELKKIYVLGAVGDPQYIFYREGMRILDVILESGGFTKFAKESKVVVLRKGEEQMQEFRVNAKDLMKQGDLSQNIELARGDFVIVKEGLF